MEQKFSTYRKDRLFAKKFYKRVLFGLIIICSLLLLMDFVVMPLYTKHNWEYELPDVTDRPVTEAMEILDSCGFVPLIKDSVYDEKFSPGSVIQQNPLPFSKVKSGRRVYLIVSIGEKPLYVPALIGLTPQDAEFRLREQELNLNQVFYEFSDFYPRGVVISQSLPAGEVAQKNQRVNITVSLGVAPTTFEIPNLVGKSLDTAEKELEAIGVKIAKVKYSYRPQLVPGTVLNQSLEAGSSAAKVESISLLVSTDQPPSEETQEDTIIGKIGE